MSAHPSGFRRLLYIVILAALLSGSVVSAQEAVECEDGFYLLEHELLASASVCVPENPQHVAALDMTMIELLMIAGTPPTAFSGQAFTAFLRMHPELETELTDLMETAVDVGFPPNIESVLASEPDLIISPHDFISQMLFPQLNGVAPTVLFTPQPGDWRSRLIFAGEILGLTDTVDVLLADYDARVDELRELLAESEIAVSVSLVRTFPDQVGLVVSGTAAAALLESVGLSRPESQAVDYDYVLNELGGRPEIVISLEQLPLAEADIVFVFGQPEALIENPLWQALPAAQDERVFAVGYYWWGDDLLSAHGMLDDLFLYVAQTEPENPNPFKTGFVETEPEAETDES